ncbi:MAG: dihydropteroate synthase [Thermoleophilia bacterium]|jgi:dihydropteroate synthase
MVFLEDSPQVLALRDIDQVRATLTRMRVSSDGVDIMSSKALFRLVRVTGLDPRAANILKQEMLSKGGEAAISREVYAMEGGKADCLIMGTLTQFEHLLSILERQPFGLPSLAADIKAALLHYDTPVPQGPAGLSLDGAPLLMGALNVTPDSFSDGDSYLGVEAAVAAALTMAGEGADLVDVGGESTRPGADSVSVEEESRRVLPVVKELAPILPGRISVNTYKASVAAQALAVGAYLINDISALRADPEMVAVVRDAQCPVVLMHMQGDLQTMHESPPHGDVVENVYRFFVERLNWAVDQGLREEDLLIDPGLGFGKTMAHNIEILRDLATFRSLGRPLVVGASRKRFLGTIIDQPESRERDIATAVVTALAAWEGAHVLRVHHVGANREAVRIAQAMLGGRPPA